MQFRFCSLFLAFSAIVLAAIPGRQLLAQTDIPNDPSTAMTIDSGTPVLGTENPDNQNIAGEL
jgi:hypothetical protein